MLKVLRVPATTPVVWQKSLLDSEIETLLRGGYTVKSRPAPKPYVKKRKEEPATAQPEDADVDRHELVDGEVCAICQEDMEDDQPLTFCRKGCGNNFHIECMKVFSESRRQSKENIICPLCRQDWGELGLSALRKELDAANRAPNVHKGAACKKCKTKPIRCERYRCVQCKNVDLCARCFKANVHSNHTFVMKHNVQDPWVPALRESQPRTAISSDIIRELENRELSTNDYDVLLQLDHGDKYPIQDYLVKVVAGTKVSAENSKTFGEVGAMCSICAQSLRIKAALHSTLCGHVFHESCLARSILSQLYACPFPGCDHSLLPGLLYLQRKHEKCKTQQPTEPEHESPSAAPVLSAAFTVLGLQQQRLDSESPRVSNLLVSAARATKRRVPQNNRRESQELPLLPGLISVGIIPHERRDGDLPVLTSPASNQLERETIASRSEQDRTTRTKGRLVKQTRVRNALPPLESLPPFPIANNAAEDRHNHAEKIRAELKAVERERLQKQRLLREERRQRHKENNNTPAFGGGFIRTSNLESEQGPKLQVTRAQKNKEFKRKPKERHHHSREQNQVPISLPDLYIGSRR